MVFFFQFKARRCNIMSNQGLLAQPSTNIGTTVRKRSATATEINDNFHKRHAPPNAGEPYICGSCILFIVHLGGVIESTFVRTNRANIAAVDTSTVVHLKKAHTTCDAETGEVEIVWPDNAKVHEGVLGKDIFASGATKNVYKVSIFHLWLLS